MHYAKAGVLIGAFSWKNALLPQGCAAAGIRRRFDFPYHILSATFAKVSRNRKKSSQVERSVRPSETSLVMAALRRVRFANLRVRPASTDFSPSQPGRIPWDQPMGTKSPAQPAERVSSVEVYKDEGSYLIEGSREP
jgi:hypothetical protein